MIKHYWVTLGIVLVLSVASLFASSFYLKTQTNILDLYSKDDPTQQAYQAYIDKFGTTEDLVVGIEGKDPNKIYCVIDALSTRLNSHPDLIRSLYYRMDLAPLESHALYFLNAGERQEFKTHLEDPADPLHALIYADKPHVFFDRLADKILEGKSDSATPQKELARLTDLIEGMEQSVVEGKAPSSKPWKHFLQTKEDERDKIFDDNGYLRADPTLYLMFVRPQDAKGDASTSATLVKTVRQDIADVTQDFPDIYVGVTGAPALNADQFAVAQTDMTYASIFSLVAIAIVFMLAFHEWLRPVLASVSLVIGIVWSFGFTTLTVGHLNLFSLAFASMLVSQGNDFSIHVISRYEEELLHGLTPLAALARTLRVSGKSIFFGALTTACAFWTTLTVDLKGFAELGFIAGWGLLICVLATLVSLPSMLYIRDHMRWRPDRPLAKATSHESSFFQKWGNVLQAHRGKIEIALLSLSVLALYAIFSPHSRFGFDYNLLHLQARHTEAVRYEEKLVAAHLTPRNAIWLSAQGTSQDEIETKIAAFKTLPSVERVESLSSLIPLHQNDAQTFIEDLKKQDTPQNEPLSNSSANEWASTFAHLDRAFRFIRNKTFKSGRSDLLPYSERLLTANAELTKAATDPLFIKKLDPWNESFFTDFRGFFSRLLSASPLVLADYPQEIRDRFVSCKGAHVAPSSRNKFGRSLPLSRPLDASSDTQEARCTQAIYIVPKGSIWKRADLSAFMADIRRIEPNVTGNPVQMYETLERVRVGYTKSAIYAFIAIFLITLIDFRKIKHAALCTASLGMSLLWLFGLMSITGLEFNIANLIAVPIILGIGIDSSIHVFHRYREKRDWGDVFCHTGKAVSLTNLTTLLGFVGMAVSRHQGLASMGQILVVGLSLCFVGSLVIWPIFLLRFDK